MTFKAVGQLAEETALLLEAIPLAQGGDERAYAEILKLVEWRVWSVLRQFSSQVPRRLWDDLRQEALAGVHSGVVSFDTQRVSGSTSVGAYLGRCAWRAAWSWLNKYTYPRESRDRLVFIEAEENDDEEWDDPVSLIPDPSGFDPESAMVQAQAEQELAAIIEMLPEPERTFARLVFVDEVKADAAGRVIGLKPDSANYFLRSKVRPKLKRIWDLRNS